MAQTVKLLPHQARFVQAPYVFPDTRFFILCGGFACGKTSSLVYAVMHAIKLLLGKKDKEGHNPKIMVCSKNITFLAKTWTNAFEQNLKMTNSEYTFDRAKNIITVGNVELILVPTEEPSNIYGYSCFRGDTLISTDKGEKPISDVKEGDFVLTTEGFKKVLKNINQGVKDCIKVTVDNTDIYCTSDHRFIDEFNNEIEAKDLTKTTSLVKVDTKEWRKWLDTNGRIEQNLRLLISMVSDITDTRSLNHTEKGAITPAQTKISKKVSQLYTEICGLVSLVKYQKAMMCITKTETLLTILLRTLNLLQEVNTLKNIGSYNQKKKESNLLKQLKKQEREIKNFCKTLYTERKDGVRLSKDWKALGIQENVRFVKSSLGRTAISQNIVDNVLKLLKKTNVIERIGKTLKHESVLSVNKSSVLTNTQLLKPARLTAKTSNVVGQYTVYDLCVEGCHEFFANGVRVHNCALAVVDELDELPTGIAMEAVKSINDRVRQQIDGFRSPFICFATTSQGLKGLYQTVLHFQKAGIGYLLMRARTRDNTYLPADYVKNMYSIYNEKEVACLLEGQFVSIDSGLVFPDYDPKKNKLDVDLFDSIADEDTVYIGQDFNCTTGDVLIETLKGRVKMKNIKIGDYVLTRKGYKKVLHKVCKGVKTVQDFNNGLVATVDHIAITPDGEMELCKAKRFYCLQRQNTELLKEERKALLTVLKLKKLLLKEKCIRETQKEATVAQSTSVVEKNFCIEQFTKSILEKYKKEIRYIIKTVLMTTDLKVLKKCLTLNTRKNTSLKKLACILKLPKENLESIINLLQGSNSTVEYLKTLGKAENTLVKLFVWTVALYSKQKSEQHSVVSSARSNGICIERESVIKALNEFVLFVESILQEQVQQSIVKNTKVIGKDLIGNERKEKVYDISVEDAHEFYANGILVHNCFGNHAVALVVKKFTDGKVGIVAIKDYVFPDIRRAPEVFRYDYPTQRIVWIPDMTYKEHFTEFKKELRIYNIKIAYRSCNPLVNDRVFACNKLFYSEHLFITPICKNLEKALLTHQRDPKTGAPMKGGVNAPDHDSDAFGMAIHYLLSWNRDLKGLYDVTLNRLYSKRRARGADATELEIDTRILSPDKLKSVPLSRAVNVNTNAFNPSE